MTIFERLNRINVNGHTETKGAGGRALTYLSWAWAWAEVKKAYPMSYYTVYESKDGCLYHTDGRTCWVKTGVTVVDGDIELEHIEYLPVMDNRNASFMVDKVTSFDVNKAIQRSLTKACARHGLGLYIYAGEDLPEGDTEPEPEVEPESEPEVEKKCSACRKIITDYNGPSGVTKAAEIARKSVEMYGRCLCGKCAVKMSDSKKSMHLNYDPRAVQEVAE